MDQGRNEDIQCCEKISLRTECCRFYNFFVELQIKYYQFSHSSRVVKNICISLKFAEWCNMLGGKTVQTIHLRVHCEGGRSHYSKIRELYVAVVSITALKAPSQSSTICHPGLFIGFSVSREFVYVDVLKTLWFSDFPHNQRFFLLSSENHRGKLSTFLCSFPPEQFSYFKYRIGW
jgi:hypothetical protein